MEFTAFADRATAIESTPADLETVGLVGDLLEDANDDLKTVVRFLLGRVFPAHDTRTLDVGPSLCREAIAKAAGPNVDPADVEDRLADIGEIGAVAASYEFGGQRGLTAFMASSPGSVDSPGSTNSAAAKSLTVAEVDRRLRSIAATEGEGSERTKLDELFGLFNRCDSAEARVLARLVLGEMRLGVGEGAIRDAITEAFLPSGSEDADAHDDPETRLDDPEHDSGETNGNQGRLTGTEGDLDPVATVTRALQVTNDYGRVAALARDRGREGLLEEGLEIGRPVQAMLAQAGTAADAIDAWGRAAVETKFDGARIQIHYAPADGIGPELYSRNMDDVTDALPEIAERVESAVDVPVILDGEVVAVDADGDPLPFQEVLRRFRRKHDVGRMREEVKLRLHAFDCLHADGEDLLDTQFLRRHDRLRSILPERSAAVSIVEDADAIAAIEAQALSAGHEGVMLKDPDAAYTPGDRGQRWLKRKPDVETLDLVVTGAEWGEGRRASTLGTFEVSVRASDQSGDTNFEPIGKVATGLTDAELESLTDRLEPYVRAEDGTDVDVRPAIVLEVGYEEIQQSPTYGSGYALRFPRFLGVREDKDVADADTLTRVERLADEE
ncbi:ATP-dependent DNA ligase LigA [Halopenitus sp. H-Gu1]|uniref:ATP-dependent DNA ligase LigA n=1 Tax=Halopenitus sp. H-Gu1 TaxID=3242697 RepID=UPI00359D395D